MGADSYGQVGSSSHSSLDENQNIVNLKITSTLYGNCSSQFNKICLLYCQWLLLDLVVKDNFLWGSENDFRLLLGG